MKTSHAQQKLNELVAEQDSSKSELTLLLERVHDLAPIALGLSVATMFFVVFSAFILGYHFSVLALCVIAGLSLTLALAGSAINQIQVDSLFKRDGQKISLVVLVVSAIFFMVTAVSL